MYTVIVGALLGLWLCCSICQWKIDVVNDGLLVPGLGCLGGLVGCSVAIVFSWIIPTQPVLVHSDLLVGMSTTDGSLHRALVYEYRDKDTGETVDAVCVKNDDGSLAVRDLPSSLTTIDCKGNPHKGGQLLTGENVCIAPWDKWTLPRSTAYELRVPPGSIVYG